LGTVNDALNKHLRETDFPRSAASHAITNRTAVEPTQKNLPVKKSESTDRKSHNGGLN